MPLPPGSRAPALYQTLRWLRDPEGSLERDFARFGPTYSGQSSIFGAVAIFTRPETVKAILAADGEVLAGGEASAVFKPLLGDVSVLSLDGPAHLRIRRLMLPAFHGERMRCLTGTMREATERALAGLRPGDRIEMHRLLQQITLDVILCAVLGLGDGPEQARLREAITHLTNRIQSPTGAVWLMPALQKDLGPLTPWASIKREIDGVNALLTGYIRARREGGGGGGDDVLAALIEARDEQGVALTDEELRSALMTLLVAGHETSATALAWAFEEVLRHPGEVDRLREELGRVTDGAALASEHLPRLDRLDSALKEVLRLHPVTASIARRVKRPVTLEGYALEPGVLAVACVYLTHRTPELYPEPARFQPERFLGKKIDPYEWIPFGGGTRRCLGMAFAMHEMKVVLATILARLDLRLSRGEEPPRTTLRSFLSAPAGGTRAVVTAVRA